MHTRLHPERLPWRVAVGAQLFAVVRLTTDLFAWVAAPCVAVRGVVRRVESQSDRKYGVGGLYGAPVPLRSRQVDAVTARPSAGLRRPRGSAQARERGAVGGGAVMLSPVRNPGEGGANGSIVTEI